MELIEMAFVGMKDGKVKRNSKGFVGPNGGHLFVEKATSEDKNKVTGMEGFVPLTDRNMGKNRTEVGAYEKVKVGGQDFMLPVTVSFNGQRVGKDEPVGVAVHSRAAVFGFGTEVGMKPQRTEVGTNEKQYHPDRGDTYGIGSKNPKVGLGGLNW